MDGQTFVVRLDSELARRVMGAMNAPGQGYNSLDEFVSVALLNQLGAEAAVKTTPAKRDGLVLAQTHGMLKRPSRDAELGELADSVASSDGLFILTNRLSPLKVATRVLVNLQALVGRLGDDRTWPTVKTFQTTAGHAARALGFELHLQLMLAQRALSNGIRHSSIVSAGSSHTVHSFEIAANTPAGSRRP